MDLNKFKRNLQSLVCSRRIFILRKVTNNELGVAH